MEEEVVEEEREFGEADMWIHALPSPSVMSCTRL